MAKQVSDAIIKQVSIKKPSCPGFFMKCYFRSLLEHINYTT